MADWSLELNATPEIQTICDQVKSQVLKNTGINGLVYKAEKYRFQGVADVNYSVKIFVGNTDYAHLHATKNLNDPTAEFLEVLFPKTKADPLETF